MWQPINYNSTRSVLYCSLLAMFAICPKKAWLSLAQMHIGEESLFWVTGREDIGSLHFASMLDSNIKVHNHDSGWRNNIAKLKLSQGLLRVDDGLLIPRSLWLYTVGKIHSKTKSKDAS